MSNQNIQLQTLKGFRDFLPVEKRRRTYVITTIQNVFERFGFEPIETPTLEYASLLQGKYGEEADKLMYTFEDRGQRKIGMRYDQTVPTARLLSQYINTLPKFFRRYQLQNVFRAENTQKGRYREFLQCDCDIFGTISPLADAEILAVFYETYAALGFTSFSLRINDRALLFDVLEPFATDTVSVRSIIQSVDKLDKIQNDGVKKELGEKGLEESKAQELIEVLKGSPMTESLNRIQEAAINLGVPADVLEFQPTLARGLDYYTGLIFEGVIPEYSGGSVGGGGRYDNLIKDLGGPQIPAVGFAIGFDRTMEILEELKLLPAFDATSQVLVTIFDEARVINSAQVAAQLRKDGINTELYPQIGDPLGKQMKYANDKQIPFVIIIGPDEAKEDMVTMKNMQSGEEKQGKLKELMTNVLRARTKEIR